jgi:hypothetical protein
MVKTTTSTCGDLDLWWKSPQKSPQKVKITICTSLSVLLWYALAATDSEQERSLIFTLHAIAHCFLALDKYSKANAAANEALERNHGRALEDCDYAPNIQVCFVCQKAMITASLRDTMAGSEYSGGK